MQAIRVVDYFPMLHCDTNQNEAERFYRRWGYLLALSTSVNARNDSFSVAIRPELPVIVHDVLVCHTHTHLATS